MWSLSPIFLRVVTLKSEKIYSLYSLRVELRPTSHGRPPFLSDLIPLPQTLSWELSREDF